MRQFGLVLAGGSVLMAVKARISAMGWRVLRHLEVPKSNRGRALLVLLFVAMVGGGAGGLYWAHSTALQDDAFTIGDRVVTVDQLDKRVQVLDALYGVRPPKNDQKKLATFRRYIAKAVAVSMVLQDEATKLHIVVADRQARQVLDNYVRQRFGDGPDARDSFVKALGNVGTSERAVLDEIRQQSTIAVLFDRTTRGVLVSDAELRAYFPKYRNALSMPERRHLFNIVVSSQDRANQLVTELKGGASFTDLAMANSIDGSTRSKGGDLGRVTGEQLRPDYARVAFAAGDGEIFGPVRNNYGWNVGKVSAIIPGKNASYDRVKNQLKHLVLYDKKLHRWRNWLSKVIRDADIRYAQDYQPKDQDSVPSVGQLGGQPAGPAPEQNRVSDNGGPPG
jgi:peptidyl-prolyl cis-trans isomerase C